MAEQSFEIKVTNSGIIVLSGRFDASCAENTRRFFRRVVEEISSKNSASGESGSPESARIGGASSTRPGIVAVDLKDLVYIASSGLGVLLNVQQELSAWSHQLKLLNPNQHVSDILHYSGFDQIFEVEKTDG